MKLFADLRPPLPLVCRLKQLLGYGKGDLEGRSPFGLQHHEDLGATAKCGEGSEWEWLVAMAIIRKVVLV